MGLFGIYPPWRTVGDMSSVSFFLKTYRTLLLVLAVALLTSAALYWVSHSAPDPADLPPPVQVCLANEPCGQIQDPAWVSVSSGNPVVLDDTERVVSVSVTERTGRPTDPPAVVDNVLDTSSLPPGSYLLAVLFESGRAKTLRLEVLPPAPATTR